MGVEAPETCWATQKRQVINLRNCCIWLVNLFELVDMLCYCVNEDSTVPASCFGTHTELYIPFAGHRIHSTAVNEQNVCSCFISEFLQPDRRTGRQIASRKSKDNIQPH